MRQQRRTETGEILPLTSLRGITAVWVVLYHTYESYDWLHFASGFVLRGYLGVDIFFTLSGFILAVSHCPAFKTTPLKEFTMVFMVKRVARVWPLYAFCTLCYTSLFLCGLGGKQMSAGELGVLLPINLAMIQEWHLGASIIRPGWSISAELAAYLLFPLLLRLAVLSRAAAAVTCGGVAISFLVIVGAPDGIGHGTINVWEPDSFWPIARCISEFTLGMLAYRVFMIRAARRVIRKPWVAWITLAALIILLPAPNTDVLLILTIPLLLLLLATRKTLSTRLLALRPFVFLGRISYAIYLLHWAFLPAIRVDRPLAAWMSPAAAHLLALCVTYAALVGAATLLYHRIEKPGRRWIMSMVSRSDLGSMLLSARVPAPASGSAAK